MPRLRSFSVTTFNLYNLNEPGLRIYRDADGWSEAEYRRKIAWSRRLVRALDADVFGFQELWHKDSLKEILDISALSDYEPLAPDDATGKKIVCAAAVRREILASDPEWITAFPPHVVEALRSEGRSEEVEVQQTGPIAIKIDTFSRPVLCFQIQPHEDKEPISVYVAHFKSRSPTEIRDEDWYDADKHSGIAKPVGYFLSSARREAEATALKAIIDAQIRKTDTPVIVLGDLNDTSDTSTLNILTGQPNYLRPNSQGGSDVDLYAVDVMEDVGAQGPVDPTYLFRGKPGILDHILVSQELYPNSRRRVWTFDRREVLNDHINETQKGKDGQGDHGVVSATFSLD
ncbi:MAG: endonuclease/exonuclease/phosphatase family protein [Pseudomonadota bacterium]